MVDLLLRWFIHDPIITINKEKFFFKNSSNLEANDSDVQENNEEVVPPVLLYRMMSLASWSFRTYNSVSCKGLTLNITMECKQCHTLKHTSGHALVFVSNKRFQKNWTRPTMDEIPSRQETHHCDYCVVWKYVLPY